MLCKQHAVVKHFFLLLREIHFLKTYLYSLVSIVITISSCSGNKNGDQSSKNGPAASKNSHLIDFAADGLENLNASGNMKDIICQNWEYKEDAADAKDADPSSDIDIVYRGYCIFKDGTMLKNPRGNMQMGKWSVDDKTKPVTISFVLDNSQAEVFQLAYLMPYEMKLSHTDEGKRKIIDLGSEAIRHIDLKEDPFYYSNNLWRIKPEKAETDEQIKLRLKNCIHFFVLFYDEKIKAHSDAISFSGLPSCFKWYGGGIFLQKENELQTKWVNSFYNREQAMKAYKLAGKLLSQKYNWPKKEGNWLKLNVAVLKQMESKVDSL